MVIEDHGGDNDIINFNTNSSNFRIFFNCNSDSSIEENNIYFVYKDIAKNSSKLLNTLKSFGYNDSPAANGVIHITSTRDDDTNIGAAVKIEKIPLKPLHDVRIVEGNIYQLMQMPRSDDYICARLTERAFNVQDKLSNCPNLLKVEFLFPQKFSTVESANFSSGGSTLDYFADFYLEQTKEPLNDDYREAMRILLTNLARNEREA